MGELGQVEIGEKLQNKKIVEVLGKIEEVFVRNDVTVPTETGGIAEGQQPPGLKDSLDVLKALSWKTIRGGMLPDGRAEAIAEDGTVWVADVYRQPNLLQVSAYHWSSRDNAGLGLGEVSLVVCRREPWIGESDLTPYWAVAHLEEKEVYARYEWGEQEDLVLK